MICWRGSLERSFVRICYKELLESCKKNSKHLQVWVCKETIRVPQQVEVMTINILFISKPHFLNNGPLKFHGSNTIINFGRTLSALWLVSTCHLMISNGLLSVSFPWLMLKWVEHGMTPSWLARSLVPVHLLSHGLYSFCHPNVAKRTLETFTVSWEGLILQLPYIQVRY